jgi:hypothetical protein
MAVFRTEFSCFFSLPSLQRLHSCISPYSAKLSHGVGFDVVDLMANSTFGRCPDLWDLNLGQIDICFELIFVDCDVDFSR